MRCCRHRSTWQCGKSLDVPGLLVSLSPIYTVRGLGHDEVVQMTGMEWPMSQSVGLGGAMAFNQDSPIPILLRVASWANDMFMGSLMNAAPTVTL